MTSDSGPARDPRGADPAPATRDVLEVFYGLYRPIDQAASLERAANACEAAFYGQTDRASTKWHHYLALYDRHLARYRGTSVRFLEIGVHDGGSLQMWRRYLGPEARIHGLDTNPRCRRIDDPDLVIHIGSQDDPEVLRRIVDELGGVDVVIDDGSHKSAHQIASFEALYPALAPDGVYLCEDVHTSYWPSFRDGRPVEESFVAYAKRLVDRLHCWYALDEGEHRDERFARMTRGVAFYDSLIVFEKEPREPPFHGEVGTRTVT